MVVECNAQFLASLFDLLSHGDIALGRRGVTAWMIVGHEGDELQHFIVRESVGGRLQKAGL